MNVLRLKTLYTSFSPSMNKVLLIEKRVKTYHFTLNFLRFSEKYFTCNFVPMCILQKLTQLKDVYNLFFFKRFKGAYKICIYSVLSP